MMDAGYMDGIEFITDREIYERVIAQRVPLAATLLWIATADIKDCYVHKGRRMVPFLEILSGLADRGVAIRLLHAKEPGPAFRADFDRYPNLAKGIEQILCPRVHFKCVVIDGTFAYSGSANLTGAGVGAKSAVRRNFESGFLLTRKSMVAAVMRQFDAVWMGKHCGVCGRKRYCADFHDLA
jgi:phosphatidylserine/phosphatidylglycerophosphate/cardiolipin synthase-like enzyme